jgi:hypothetical protein
MATFVPGACERFLSAVITPCSRLLSGGVRIRDDVPCSIAGLMIGS